MPVLDGGLLNTGRKIILKCLLRKEKQEIVQMEVKQDGVLYTESFRGMMKAGQSCCHTLIIIIIPNPCASGIKKPTEEEVMSSPILHLQKTKTGTLNQEKPIP